MKKFMSLALALIMVITMMTFGASSASADFTDADEITYTQAVEVINAIQIMDGYSDESFRPTATLTRGAAAKIICNMILGPTTASALPTSANPFPDVPSGSTFAGYIAYCVDQGIISGYADGYFRPADPLSGYAFLKMLLGALGYDQTIEGYTGPNWKVNVAKQALGIDLDKYLTHELDGSTTVTREEAALYAFNTLQADLVEYDAKTQVTVGGATVSVGNDTAKTRTWTTSGTGRFHIDNHPDGATGADLVQFGELYFDRLVREPNNKDAFTADDFGRPAIKWTWKGSEIGTYAEPADQTYTGNFKVNQIYSDLAMTSKDSNAEFYVNGLLVNDSLEVSRGNDKDLNESGECFLGTYTGSITSSEDYYNDGTTDAANNKFSQAKRRIGDGTIVEVFRDADDNHVTVCAISQYGGKVTQVKGATSKKDPCVVIDYNANNRPDGINLNSDRREYETIDFEEDDVVAFTYSDAANSIQSMYKMDSEEGSLTRNTVTKSITLSSGTFKYAKECAFDFGSESDLSNKNDYVVYLDDQGLALWIEESDFTAEQYALILRISIENEDSETVGYRLAESSGKIVDDGSSNWGERVRLLKANGTTSNYNLNESAAYRNDTTETINYWTSATAAAPTSTTYFVGKTVDSNFLPGRVVRYTQQSDGTYKLHSVPNTQQMNNKLVDAPVSTLVDGNNLYYGGLTADSKTVFVVNDDGTYKTYTGIKNAPDVNSGLAAVYYKDGTAKVVFITTGTVSSSSKDITFIAGSTASKLVENSDYDPYFEFDAVIKGSITTVRIKRGATLGSATFGAAGIFNGFSVAGSSATDDESNALIVNHVSYDSDDLLKEAYLDTTKVQAFEALGIKRPGNSDEIDLNTNANRSKRTESLASDVRVYYVDGGIEQITLSQIVSDSDDYVFYTKEDGEITYLFIQANEEDNTTNYTVTFNMNGHGAAVSAKTVGEGNSVAVPEAPAEAGWIFGGWYTTPACTAAYDFNKPVYGDITLYAKWDVDDSANLTPTGTTGTTFSWNDSTGVSAVRIRNAVAAAVGESYDAARGDSVSVSGSTWTVNINGIAYTVTVVSATAQSAEEAPAAEAPAETPAEETPAAETPAEETPAAETPAEA